MKLIKYCRSEHHISRTKFLQVGTLEYYRQHDSKFIADPEEATATHVVRGNRPIDVSAEQLSTVSQGTNLQLVVDGGMLIHPGGTFGFSGSVPNCPIYCVSLVEEGSQEMAASFGYDSFYEIIDPSRFATLVQLAILEQLDDRVPKGRTGITGMLGPIEYVDERVHHHQSWADDFERVQRALFTKPRVSPMHSDVRFDVNSEFRFAWMVTQGDYWIEISSAPFLVPVTNEIRATCR